MATPRAAALLSCFALAGPLPAAEAPPVALALAVPFQARAGQVAEAAPRRFVMLADGQVFVGGTSGVETCLLAKRDLARFRSEIDAIRRPKKKQIQPWLTGPTVWSFGGSAGRVQLTFSADEQGKLPLLRLEAVGETRGAPVGLRPLADFIDRLADFDHPCLRPYAPAAYRLRAAEGPMPGGCRPPGSLEPALASALAGPVAVPAEAAAGWPHGATAAQVCHRGKRYVVTLTPLLPGERL